MTYLELFSKVRFESLTNFMAYFTILGSGFSVLILVAILLHKKKESLLKGWVSLGLALLITWILKVLIAKVRPEFGLVAETGFGFPSGHATAVFAVYPLLKNNYWLIFAILIVISRLYLGVHYLSDVLGGILVGLVVGNFVLRSKHFKRIENKIFKK